MKIQSINSNYSNKQYKQNNPNFKAKFKVSDNTLRLMSIKQVNDAKNNDRLLIDLMSDFARFLQRLEDKIRPLKPLDDIILLHVSPIWDEVAKNIENQISNDYIDKNELYSTPQFWLLRAKNDYYNPDFIYKEFDYEYFDDNLPDALAAVAEEMLKR